MHQEANTELYRKIWADPNHHVECRLAIGENGRLIDNSGDRLVFATSSGETIGILLGQSGADSAYDETTLISMRTSNNIFGGNKPAIGVCPSAEIDVEMLKPTANFGKRARLVPYVRLTDDDGEYTDWMQKGVYYIDTREYTPSDYGLAHMTLHGYDMMLQLEEDFPSYTGAWVNKTDMDVIRIIANHYNFDLDDSVMQMVTKGYIVPLPTMYSCRETLGYIAAMYAGCFTFNDEGNLQLITLYSIPRETGNITDEIGYELVFGYEDSGDPIHIRVVL